MRGGFLNFIHFSFSRPRDTLRATRWLLLIAFGMTHLRPLVSTIASLLVGTMTAWMLASALPDPARAFDPVYAPVLSFSPAAGFGGTDAINPDTAPINTPLTFSLVYTHPDNHPPIIAPIVPVFNHLIPTAYAHGDNGQEEAITIFVNTTDFSFFDILKLYRDTTPDPAFPHLHDGDYTNGEQFSLTVPTGFPYAADYEFYFQATDGEHWRYLGQPWVDGPFTFTLTPTLPSNHAPTLSFSQETDYLTDGVNPDKGTADVTPLVFKIIYTDADNDPPPYVAVSRDDGTGAILSFLQPDTAETIPIALRDGNFINGEQYTRTDTFPKGQYQYHFETSDGEESSRLPATGELTFQTGYSNVAFLPGFLGSRLYQYDYDCLLVDCENQLWDPNIPYIPDIKKLYLTTSGTPINPDIYTKPRDIIDESWQNPLEPGANVYKEFIEFMDDLVGDNVISAWEPLSYDWRLPLETTVNGGVHRPANTFVDLVQVIEGLAEVSASGKVTLIGHSNGGLLAKVLINRLNTEGKSSLIDRLVMVGTPQLGTPEVIQKLLHGLSPTNEATRQLLENMPGAYNFLPSSEYFNRVADPVVEFDPEVSSIYDFPGIYGTSTDTVAEFTKFLLGDNGLRTEPASGDTDAPNVLKANLLTGAQSTHNALDGWTPPQGIEVIQIAGWGLDTLRGVRYDDCDIPFCSQTLSHLDRSPLETEDGDGTVVVPSATAMNVQTYYLNLPEHNREGIFNQRINRDHSSMMEVDSIQVFIKQIIERLFDNDNPPTHISISKPEPKEENKKLRIRGLSPITIDVYDAHGNHTGPVSTQDPDVPQLFESKIPNSYYYKIGEKTYLGLDTQDQYRIEIDGLALGSFTLEIDEVFDDEVVDSVAYINIPITSNTKASLTTQTVDTTSSLSLDVQGDGKPDVTVSPSEKPDPKASLKALKAVVNTLTVQKAKVAIIKQIEAAELALNKRLPKVADGILKGLVKQLQNFPKIIINPSNAQALIQIIEVIRAILV